MIKFNFNFFYFIFLTGCEKKKQMIGASEFQAAATWQQSPLTTAIIFLYKVSLAELPTTSSDLQTSAIKGAVS